MTPEQKKRREKVQADLRERILRLVEEGLSAQKIAEITGKDPRAISRILRKNARATERMMRYGKTERAPQTTVATKTKTRFEAAREKAGHTQSEAVEEALRMYIEMYQ